MIVMVLQVAFRAKVGKRYQLPHKGIIPEEFGVVIFILYQLKFCPFSLLLIPNGLVASLVLFILGG